MSNLILTICSNRKSENRERNEYNRNARTVASVILENDLRQKLSEARKQAFEHIKNSKDKEGYSVAHPSNEELKCGPDIDFDSKKRMGFYMPALKRYHGKFYKNFKSEVGNIDLCIQRMRNDSEDHLLIVSGLYGLLTTSEPIQTYDCYVENGSAIQQLWKKDDLLTELVLSYMCECGINRVFDFMADDSYRHLIDWELIKEADNTVFRSCHEKQTRTDMLSELGKAAGLLLSGKTAQKLSEIEHLDKIELENVDH